MTAQKVCNLCGTLYPDTERFCPRDGSALRAVNADPSDLVGQIVADRYLVVRKLGAGGMGQVYLAEHVKMGRQIALKVLKPSFVPDPDAIARFNREASNASRINHPNVAAVYDFGETPDGLAFLAMEYIDGPTLTKLITQLGAIVPKRAAEIVRQASEALAVAHDMGIVHRDLKPDNIMIARNRDGSDLVKVVDFGIAKAAGIDAQKVTQTGLVVGTPEYMSPEQLAADKLDGRSDIYSLGLVAFNMLTGRMPFQSESAQESIIMRLTDKPKSLSDVRPDVAWPPEVQRVMDRALERDVALRYSVASEFGQALVLTIKRMSAAVAPTALLEPAPSNENAKAESVLRDGTRGPGLGSRRLAAIAGAAVVVVTASIGFAVWRGQQPGVVPPGATQQGASGDIPAGGDSAKRVDSTKGITVDQPSRGAKGDGTNGGGASRGRSATNGNVRAFGGGTPSSATQLTIRASDISEAFRRKIEPALRRATGFTVVSDSNAAADLVLSVDRADGKLLLRRTTSAEPVARIDTVAPAQPLLVALRHEFVVAALGALDTPDAKRGLEFEVGGGKRSFHLKETIAVRVRSQHGGYLTLIDTDPSGSVAVLHPSGERDVGRIDPNQLVRFESDFTAAEPIGHGVIRAIFSDRPLKLERDGPVLTAANGTALAEEIRRQIVKMTADGGRAWSTAAISYSIVK